MSRTSQDARRLSTASNAYRVVRRADGSYDIFHNSKLVHRAVKERWLEGELAKYGICGQEFRQALSQLEHSGLVELIY